MTTQPQYGMFSTKWQMALGERAAIEGILASTRPSLSVEIGTAQGGSLARIASYSDETYSLDLDHEQAPSGMAAGKVTFVTGNSHETLPALLAKFVEEGRNLDFVLVDGDHSRNGIHQDVKHLLASPAVGNTVILLHDTFNPHVRRGIEDALSSEHKSKIAHIDLGMVPAVKKMGLMDERWGGLGFIIVRDGADNFRIFDQSIKSESAGSVGYTMMHATFEPVRRIVRLGKAGKKRLKALTKI